MPSPQNAPDAPGKRRQNDSGLAPADIALVQHVWHFCKEHSDLEILKEVLALPTPARRELLALLEQLVVVVDVDEEKAGDALLRSWIAVGDGLHAWARKHGLARRLADAFIMRRETWRAVHTMEALRRAGEP